jgi:hypothetical protein
MQQRESTKHGRVVDEALAYEVSGMIHAGRDTRAEEWRSSEPSGEDQPDVDRAPGTTLAGGVPEGMTEADVERRSELARWLNRAAFPARRDGLLDRLRAAYAPDKLVELVGTVPDAEYGSVGELYRAVAAERRSE